MSDAAKKPDANCSERMKDQQVSDRYLPLSRFWLARMISRPSLISVDTEQLANATVFKLIRWLSKQDAESILLPRDVDCVCRMIAKRIASQAIRDATRHKRRHIISALRFEDYVGESYTTSEADPQQIAMQNELVEMVMDSLEAPEARLLELKLHGWTNSEIADHIGTTIRQIQSLFVGIRKKLSRHFALRIRTQDTGLRTQDTGLRTQDSGLRKRRSKSFLDFLKIDWFTRPLVEHIYFVAPSCIGPRSQKAVRNDNPQQNRIQVWKLDSKNFDMVRGRRS